MRGPASRLKKGGGCSDYLASIDEFFLALRALSSRKRGRARVIRSRVMRLLESQQTED